MRNARRLTILISLTVLVVAMGAESARAQEMLERAAADEPDRSMSLELGFQLVGASEHGVSLMPNLTSHWVTENYSGRASSEVLGIVVTGAGYLACRAEHPDGSCEFPMSDLTATPHFARIDLVNGEFAWNVWESRHHTLGLGAHLHLTGITRAREASPGRPVERKGAMAGLGPAVVWSSTWRGGDVFAQAGVGQEWFADELVPASGPPRTRSGAGTYAGGSVTGLLHAGARWGLFGSFHLDYHADARLDLSPVAALEFGVTLWDGGGY